ncbi:helix-turn-helix domain-containing protein [Stappia indica]|uniref:helix-turn-helix domain-containing protein n=1 Tax=Stappia indica TaxID=538381 RepID=UPI0008342642|nr:helix-turn-helix domain-containing protein [Stappia indica]
MTTTEDISRVPHSVFSLDAVPLADRFEVWRESIGCVFEVGVPRERRVNGFRAELDAHVIGDVALARTSTEAQSWARSSATIARDGMDHLMIQIYEQGRMEFSHRGRDEVFGQDALVIFDLAQEMRSETSDFTNLSLLVPRSLIEPQLKQAADRHMQVIQAEGNPLARLLIDHMTTLKALAPGMNLSQGTEASAATVALTAACLNASRRDDGQGEAGIAFALLVRARQRIAEHLRDPELSPARVARLSGVSRTRLYEMFEPFGGVLAYIREQRLRLALRMLIDHRFAEWPISAVASACGFANDSAFSRAFRARFGTTARDMRAAPAGAERVSGDFDRDLDRRYEEWIRLLSA